MYSFSKSIRSFGNFPFALSALILFSQSIALAKDEPQVQLTELGSAVAMPVYGTDNITAAFEDPGFGFTLDYSANPATAVNTGIPTLGAVFSSRWFAAQTGFAVGSGFLSLSPGVGVQIAPINLRFGAYTNLQFNSFQWNNARAFVQWAFGDQWSIGARAGLAVVTGGLDEITLGVGKSWGILQTAIDLQADGTFGTFRLMPGVGLRLGIFETAVSGSLARSSNWTFYADRLKVTLAVRIGKVVFVRASYETPYVAGLGVGITL